MKNLKTRRLSSFTVSQSNTKNALEIQSLKTLDTVRKNKYKQIHIYFFFKRGKGLREGPCKKAGKL